MAIRDESDRFQRDGAVKQLKNGAVVFGFLLVLSGLLLNKWSLERTLSPDEYIESWSNVAVIVMFELLLLVIGGWFLLKRPAISVSALVRGTVAFGLIAGVCFGLYGNLKAIGVIDPQREYRMVWDKLIASEELILTTLTPQMKSLTASAMNLQFPDHQSHKLFEDRVEVVDLAPDAGQPLSQILETIQVGKWPVASASRSEALKELRLWRSLFSQVEYFGNAKFYIIKGKFIDEQRSRHETEIGFDALARLKSGKLMWIRALQTVRWKQRPAAEAGKPPTWHVYEWRTDQFATMEADKLLFEEVLDRALAPSDLARARRSVHEELVLQYLLDEKNFKKPHDEFYVAAVDRHPGIAVVDLDRDGFDDIYIMEREGKNMFFRNRGDGTFEEIAAKLGLDIDGFSSSAIFADFDNDGDIDVFIGRTLKPSIYLRNENGRFVDRTKELISGPLTHLVSSVTAVDYNNDGLLDLYVSTYAARMTFVHQQSLSKGFSKFLPEPDIKELDRLLKSKDMEWVKNVPGPPNVLLKNLGGGKFEVVKDSPLRVFRNTYQATWADYDGDGLMDVYLANDFAPNNLFRNLGNGKFVDVTAETGTTDIGFGMGVAWGDYDNDGKQDLYVSNMYSKAGKRITSALVGFVDPVYAQMAGGNSLFRNSTKKFDKVSGLEPPALLVENALWSWGSQFVDVDNDGYLDIYALSGHYTPPKELDVGLDL